MKLLKAKDGKFSLSSMDPANMIYSTILIVLVLKTFAVGLPEIASAGNEVYEGPDWNGTDGYQNAYPLTSLFASDSVLLLAVVGAVLVAVVLSAMPKKGR